MKRSKGLYLANSIIWGLCALLWWSNFVAKDSGFLQLLCALVWSCGAVIWWFRYRKARKMEQED